MYLLVTHSGDFYTIDRVQQKLLDRGVQAIRLNSDEYPEQMSLSLDPNSNDVTRLHFEGRSVIAADIVGVWLRRLWPAKLSEEVDPRYRASAVNESMETLQSFLAALDDAFWINDMQRSRYADNKFRQLRLARQLGIAVPRTIITNSPEDVRSFHRSLGGKRMVAKLLTALSQSMEPTDYFLYTSDVSEGDMEQLAGLRYSPMVFQEKIEKQRELRIVYVDGRFFTGAIDAGQSKTGQTDWRRSRFGDWEWEPETLPDDLCRRLEQMMRTLGLVYAAIDVIVTPKREFVFLEVNTAGEWGMLEKDLNYDISGAIADALVRNTMADRAVTTIAASGS